MKNKNKLSTLISVLLIAASIWFVSTHEPTDYMKTNANGWLLVRSIAIVWSFIMAIGTYCPWPKFFEGIKELFTGGRLRRVYSTKLSKNLELITWVIWSSIVVQILMTFYVAKWCISGF